MRGGALGEGKKRNSHRSQLRAHHMLKSSESRHALALFIADRYRQSTVIREQVHLYKC